MQNTRRPLGWSLTYALRAMIGAGVLIVAATRPTHAADGKRIFRYRDAQGVLQIASVLPPGQAQAGYEVLDATTLRALAVVAPAPSDGDRAAQEAQQRQAIAAAETARKAELRRQHQANVRQQRDRMLLQIYASEADLLALRDAKLGSLRLIEKSIDSTVGHLRVNLQRMDTIVAEHKAAGRAPPPQLLAAQDQTAADLAEQEQAAARLQAERATLRAQFEGDLRRYRELTATN